MPEDKQVPLLTCIVDRNTRVVHLPDGCVPVFLFVEDEQGERIRYEFQVITKEGNDDTDQQTVDSNQNVPPRRPHNCNTSFGETTDT